MEWQVALFRAEKEENPKVLGSVYIAGTETLVRLRAEIAEDLDELVDFEYDFLSAKRSRVTRKQEAKVKVMQTVGIVKCGSAAPSTTLSPSITPQPAAAAPAQQPLPPATAPTPPATAPSVTSESAALHIFTNVRQECARILDVNAKGDGPLQPLSFHLSKEIDKWSISFNNSRTVFAEHKLDRNCIAVSRYLLRAGAEECRLRNTYREFLARGLIGHGPNSYINVVMRMFGFVQGTEVYARDLKSRADDIAASEKAERDAEKRARKKGKLQPLPPPPPPPPPPPGAGGGGARPQDEEDFSDGGLGGGLKKKTTMTKKRARKG